MISFEDSRRYFKRQERVTLTGNPVREEIFFTKKNEARETLGLDQRPFVLSFAGSLGAREINRAMIEFIALCAREGKFQLCHATGERGFAWMPGEIRKSGVDLDRNPHIRLVSYIYNMPTVLAAADLVICRAGAITLSEIAAQGKPSILIPSPNVTHNHQEFNARAFEKAGAAVVLPEGELTGQKLKAMVEEMLTSEDSLKEMGKKAQSLAFFDSAEKIYGILKDISRR
jgi:UDP-N-acetylglucosamine--N-acetylmuramyl-(pentapeptide) pyrophosphoryl-undecaprenol N-acetylglucosamine transferase